MRAAFWLAVWQLPQILWGTVTLLFTGSWRSLWRRLLVVLIGLPALGLLQLIHWLGFLVDELLFSDYRHISIERPIFITGVPRSGTTHLQRVMARHEQLTTTPAWVCLLAPSIAERRFYQWLGRLGSPIFRRLKKIELPFVQRMQAIHKLGMHEPEEDFLLLLPINACFILVLLFPSLPTYWDLAHFHERLSAKRRDTILTFYRRMVQKHLYDVESGSRYLSKNPSFCGWVKDIEAAFPDAELILCTRPAEKAVISQLSSLLPGWQLIHGRDLWSQAFEERLVDMLVAYYKIIEEVGAHRQHMTLPMHRLVSDPQATIKQLLVKIDLPMTPSFATQLRQEAEKAKRYRSQHRYQTALCHLDWSMIAHRFAAFG